MVIRDCVSRKGGTTIMTGWTTHVAKLVKLKKNYVCFTQSGGGGKCSGKVGGVYKAQGT